MARIILPNPHMLSGYGQGIYPFFLRSKFGFSLFSTPPVFSVVMQPLQCHFSVAKFLEA
jgi:hypothetical protein